MDFFSVRVVLLTATFGLIGCFDPVEPGSSDPAEPGSSGTETLASAGTSEGTGCELGFASCPCLPNGTCNVGLACEAGTVCQPDTGTTTTDSTTTSTSDGGIDTTSTGDPTTGDTTAGDTTTGETTMAETTDGDSSTGDSCGDGVLDKGEDCDDTDLAGESCASLGFLNGQLTCAADCTFDTAACT